MSLLSRVSLIAGIFNMRHSHATHDLVNHIADGEFPEWDFCIQTMELSEEHSLDFDPLDCTKVSFFPISLCIRMMFNCKCQPLTVLFCVHICPFKCPLFSNPCGRITRLHVVM